MRRCLPTAPPDSAAGGWSRRWSRVFPANVQMAVDPDGIPFVSKMGLPRWAFWARLPLQPLLIWLLVIATRRSLQPD